MKCGEFAEIVHELARHGRLDKEAAIARAHAESCPACGFLLAEAKGLAAILQEASVESLSLEAPGRVESAVMAAFRDANASNADCQRRRKPTWRLALGWAGAAAAVSLLVFASLGRIPGRGSSPAPRTGEAGSTTMTVASQKTSASLGTTRLRNPTTGADTNAASAFVPVPFAGGFAQGDSGVIVRVQVARASLADLGYPVDEAQGEGVVQADLLVGEDGWPHAVRIVK